MRKALFWVLMAGGALALLFAVILPLSFGFWPAFMEGKVSERHMRIEMTVADGEREIRSAVHNECVTSRSSGWNTGRQTGTHRTGEAPFAALPGGRMLVLTGHFNPCSSPSGTYDPSLPHGQNEGDRIALPREHALIYDNRENPKSVIEYFLPELFLTGADGVRIKSMTLTSIARPVSAPSTLGEVFPLMRNRPDVGSPDYSRFHRLTNFQGYTLSVTQLETPCEGIAADVAEPVLNSNAQNKPCRARGTRLGWITGKPNADFSELRFSTGETSKVRVSQQYRELMLRDVAPGKWRDMITDERRYAWTPRLCIDGFCFRPEPSQYLVWTKYELYLPASKRVVFIDPE